MAKHRRTTGKQRRKPSNTLRTDQKRQSSPDNQQTELTVGELHVLRIFREYLMTPGEMLCLNQQRIVSFAVPLDQLIQKKLLVAEKFHGGYSLTQNGFLAMRNAV